MSVEDVFSQGRICILDIDRQVGWIQIVSCDSKCQFKQLCTVDSRYLKLARQMKIVWHSEVRLYYTKPYRKTRENGNLFEIASCSTILFKWWIFWLLFYLTKMILQATCSTLFENLDLMTQLSHCLKCLTICKQVFFITRLPCFNESNAFLSR